MGYPSSGTNRFILRGVPALIWLAAFLPATIHAEDQTWRVTIKNRGSSLGETPLLAEIHANVPTGEYVLKGEGMDDLVGTVFKDGAKTYFGTVLSQLPDAGTLSYTLEPLVRVRPLSSYLVIGMSGKNLEIVTVGKLLTVYRPESGPKPYYFPLIGPTGEPVTRAYPMKDVPGEDHDHPHQRSLWFTHGNVNGIDFWSETRGHGTIKETSRPTVVAGTSIGVIRTTDDWLGPDGKVVCADERVVRVYDTHQVRILDFDVIVKATAGPVTFGDTKEGTFGIRVASSMDVDAKKGGAITNAEGLKDARAWGKASPWVDYTGPVAEETVGIAVLNHPESFRFPTTWHVRGYGLFAANPFGWHDFGRKDSGAYTIPNGASISFRYRVILHKGTTDSAHLADAFRAYSDTPMVEFRAE